MISNNHITPNPHTGANVERCVIQILPNMQCLRDAEKPLIYKGSKIMVCARCYEIIMDKLAKRLKTDHSGIRRKR